MINTGAAIKDVNASAADKLVITAATINHIVAISGCDQFGTVRSSERIIAFCQNPDRGTWEVCRGIVTQRVANGVRR